MNRRNFFSRLGITATAAVVAPATIIAITEDSKAVQPIDEPKDYDYEEVDDDSYEELTEDQRMMYSKSMSEADWAFGYELDKQLFLGTIT